MKNNDLPVGEIKYALNLFRQRVERIYISSLYFQLSHFVCVYSSPKQPLANSLMAVKSKDNSSASLHTMFYYLYLLDIQTISFIYQ